MPQPTIFISYSQEDEKEKNALVRQLGGLQRQGLFKVWSADQIGPGVEKQPAIQQAIAQAKVAILLITADYLDSDEIIKKEMPALLARQRKSKLIIYPVIAKYCSWETVSWLKPMQVRPPSSRGPVWREGGRYADEELAQIATEVAGLVRRSGDDSLWSRSAAVDNQSAETVGAISGSTQGDKTNFQEAPLQKETGFMTNNKTKIIVAVIGALAVLIAAAIGILPSLLSDDIPTDSSNFLYQVKVVEAGNTDNRLKGAEVTIEVGGLAPLREFTDSKGVAVVPIDSSRSEQIGRIIVELKDYETYELIVNLNKNELPEQIPLEPLLQP